MVKNIFPLVVVLLFAFIASFPLLHKGLPPTHDGEYHIVRFYQFDKTLRDGNWYPRWAADLNDGYGVPLFNYVYPLPNYVASFLHLLGFSFIDSFKLNMFFATILGAVFFYLWARGYWGYWGGMVGAIFYIYSPYHFVDIYIRGSVGEVWALAFFPAFLWAVTWYIRSRKQHFLPISSVFLALIIFSHNILALMFFPFALSYYGFLLLEDKGNKENKGDWGKWGKGIFVFLLGIGLSAIFWLPALFERQYVRGLEIFDVSAHFPNLYQLLIPSWGSGFSADTLANQMSFQIGIANLIAVFLSLLLILSRHSGLERKLGVRSLSRIFHRVWRFWSPRSARPQNDGNVNVIIFFLVWFFVIFFLMLKISLAIWQTAPFINYFQFPWRFLSLEILVTSFLAGSVVYFWQSRVLVVFLILLAFVLGIGYTKPAYYHYRDDNYYLARSNFIDGTNSPGNVFNTIWFKNGLKKQKEKLSFLKGSGSIYKRVIRSTLYVFNVKADSDSEMKVNTAYFVGWEVWIDNKKTKSTLTNDGLFSFNLAKGNHEVKIEFRNTTVRNVGMILSLLSFIILFLFIRGLFATIRK